MNKTVKEPAPRGRPVKNTMPEQIPDSPENIARSIMRGPPKKDWDYLKAAKARDSKHE